MTLKSFPDGSEITAKDAVAGVAISAVIVAAVTYATIKIDDWKTRRIMKKYNWPKK